jgi:hypothetical protein
MCAFFCERMGPKSFGAIPPALPPSVSYSNHINLFRLLNGHPRVAQW